MFRIIFSIFLILHGGVHGLYAGHSAGFFEMQPWMTWPDGSWVFSSLLGNSTVRKLAVVLLIAAALGFIAAGGGLLFKQAWWQPVAVWSSAFSTVLYLLLWNGSFQHLDNQGFVGILINLAIIIALKIFNWPNFGL